MPNFTLVVFILANSLFAQDCASDQAVCGVNGRSYRNPCDCKNDGAEIGYYGECRSDVKIEWVTTATRDPSVIGWGTQASKQSVNQLPWRDYSSEYLGWNQSKYNPYNQILFNQTVMQDRRNQMASISDKYSVNQDFKTLPFAPYSSPGAEIRISAQPLIQTRTVQQMGAAPAAFKFPAPQKIPMERIPEFTFQSTNFAAPSKKSILIESDGTRNESNNDDIPSRMTKTFGFYDKIRGSLDDIKAPKSVEPQPIKSEIVSNNWRNNLSRDELLSPGDRNAANLGKQYASLFVNDLVLRQYGYKPIDEGQTAKKFVAKDFEIKSTFSPNYSWFSKVNGSMDFEVPKVEQKIPENAKVSQVSFDEIPAANIFSREGTNLSNQIYSNGFNYVSGPTEFQSRILPSKNQVLFGGQEVSGNTSLFTDLLDSKIQNPFSRSMKRVTPVFDSNGWYDVSVFDSKEHKVPDMVSDGDFVGQEVFSLNDKEVQTFKGDDYIKKLK